MTNSLKLVPLPDNKRAISTTILPNQPVAIVDVGILKSLLEQIPSESFDDFKKSVLHHIGNATSRREVISFMGKKIAFDHFLRTMESISIETTKDGTIELSHEGEVITDENIDQITA